MGACALFKTTKYPIIKRIVFRTLDLPSYLHRIFCRPVDVSGPKSNLATIRVEVGGCTAACCGRRIINEGATEHARCRIQGCDGAAQVRRVVLREVRTEVKFSAGHRLENAVLPAYYEIILHLVHLHCKVSIYRPRV